MTDARLFFALWPDARTAAALEAVADTLAGNGRRVARAELHLTLVFLGRVDSSAIAQIRREAGRVRASGFCLRLEQVGYFPRPRVLWLGPKTTPGPLSRLVRAVAAIAPEATSQSMFRPHVSIYRHASPPASGRRMTPIVWPVRSFCLVESGSDGVPGRYACLGRWPLA